MTAHILMLLISILDPIVPVPAIKLPKVPTDAQIQAEEQKRADFFCSPGRIYPEGAVPFIAPCAHKVLDCDLTVTHSDYPYEGRCTGRI